MGNAPNPTVVPVAHVVVAGIALVICCACMTREYAERVVMAVLVAHVILILIVMDRLGVLQDDVLTVAWAVHALLVLADKVVDFLSLAQSAGNLRSETIMMIVPLVYGVHWQTAGVYVLALMEVPVTLVSRTVIVLAVCCVQGCKIVIYVSNPMVVLVVHAAPTQIIVLMV